MSSYFNPEVMTGNLSRLCVEQFAEQGQLIECRNALYRIYSQLSGAGADTFAEQLTVVCDEIAAAVNESVLTTEGLQMLARVRGLRQAFPIKDSFRTELRNLYAIDLDDYSFFCVSLAALGLTLYDPFSFDESGVANGSELSDCALAKEFDCVSEMVLARNSFGIHELFKGGQMRTDPVQLGLL